MLVSDLLSSPAAQTMISDEVSSMVSNALGGGALGAQVGPQVGAIVVSLLTNPAIGNGILTLVDTVADGLFGSAVAVDALAAPRRRWRRRYSPANRCHRYCQRFWTASALTVRFSSSSFPRLLPRRSRCSTIPLSGGLADVGCRIAHRSRR